MPPPAAHGVDGAVQCVDSANARSPGVTVAPALRRVGLRRVQVVAHPRGRQVRDARACASRARRCDTTDHADAARDLGAALATRRAPTSAGAWRMTAAGALILYPSWAIAVVLAATVARLGRATGLGLLAVCSLLALWITSMILVELPATRALAEHVIPLGMLQAGAYIHAGLDLTGRPVRIAWLGYGWGGAIGIAGAIWPR